MNTQKQPDLEMWTIYRHPKDHPHHWVVRRCWIRKGGIIQHEHECQLAHSLAEARDRVPPGLFNLGRQPEDEPQIVETWV
jgi:hypothetical protein